MLSFEVALETADKNEWLSHLFSCVTVDKFRNFSNPWSQRSENILSLPSFPSFLSYLFYSLLFNIFYIIVPPFPLFLQCTRASKIFAMGKNNVMAYMAIVESYNAD